MIRHALIVATCVLVLAVQCNRVLFSAEPHDEGWTVLFNGKDLEGWYTFLDRNGKNKDPEQVFSIEKGSLHVYKNADDGSSVPIGFISTETEYSHYHLQFKYKWGKKRFGERANEKRDAGVMYHCVGPDGVLMSTWPLCLECQVQEQETGDALCLAGSRFSTWIDPKATGLRKPIQARYLSATDGGSPFAATHWIARSTQRDHLDSWNTVDVIVMGNDYAVHNVNGSVNNRLSNLEQQDKDGKWKPLSAGRIVFQAELAEVLYHDIKIRPIPTGPFRPPGFVVPANSKGVFQLNASETTLAGPSLRFQPDENDTLGNWQDVKDEASWTIDVKRPGKYSFELEWSVDDAAAVNTFRVESGDAGFEAKVPGTGGWASYKTKVFGELEFDAGKHQITVKPAGNLKGALMDFRVARLIPIE